MEIKEATFHHLRPTFSDNFKRKGLSERLRIWADFQEFDFGWEMGNKHRRSGTTEEKAWFKTTETKHNKTQALSGIPKGEIQVVTQKYTSIHEDSC